MKPNRNNEAAFKKKNVSLTNNEIRKMISGAVGTVNIYRWFGWAAGCWLCLQMNFIKKDGKPAGTWDVDYLFLYRQDGWDPKTFDGVKIATVEVYQKRDFNKLELTEDDFCKG